jgi:redox-sensitive bicupin YhaK (pirin superfamily)
MSSIIDVDEHTMGQHFRVARVVPRFDGADPFVSMDQFWMTGPVFAPHPHAGFSAVTLLLDDAETGFRNRDSLGADLTISPGSLHWTLAGSGVMHEELPIETGKVAHGIQIFAKLPTDAELQTPRMIHVDRDDQPQISPAPGVQGRVAAGALFGARAPGEWPTPLGIATLDMTPGATWTPTLPDGWNATLIVTGGAVDVDGSPVRAAHLDARSNVTAPNGASLAVLAGEPTRARFVQHGPFMLADRARIDDAIRRYERGGMGRLQTVA